MTKNPKEEDARSVNDQARRKFLKGLALATGAGAAVATRGAWGGSTLSDAFADFFQQHYQRMTEEEIRDTMARIERKAKRRYGVEIQCENTPPSGRCRIRLCNQYIQVSRVPRLCTCLCEREQSEPGHASISV